MAGRKSAVDLARYPQQAPVRNLENTPPVNIVISDLETTKGEQLQIFTRSNPAMVKAARVAGYFANEIMNDDGTMGIPYAADALDRAMRFAISIDGEGRKELIETVKAGGDLPSEYYERSGGSSQFTDVD